MTSSAARKGNDAENRVVTWLKITDIEAMRLRLAGINEQGDILVPSFNIRLEVKNHKGTLSDVVNKAAGEAHLLAERFPKSNCFGVVARPGISVERWYLVCEMRDFFHQP